MKKSNLIINNQVVKTDLRYEDSDKLVVYIEEACNLSFNIHAFQKPVVLKFAKNISCAITTILECDCENELVYELDENTFVNEFVVIEKDGLVIEMDKYVKVAKNSNYEASNGFFTDSSIKMNVVVDLDGELTRAIHNNAVISRFDAKKVFNITINNNAKHSYGELNNFGVVKDKAKLIFNGTGYIKHGATQSQAHQESKIITFDQGVEAQANPYLIIDESDVAASHAAAVGKMDEEQLYYIQSRGIDNDMASKLITFGYLKPVLNKISDEVLKEKLEQLIEEKVGL